MQAELRRLAGALLLAVLAGACRNATPPAAQQHDSPYAAASGVTGADRADARAFHVVPLRPMTGDVEILHGDPEKPGEPFTIGFASCPGRSFLFTRIPSMSTLPSYRGPGISPSARRGTKPP